MTDDEKKKAARERLIAKFPALRRVFEEPLPDARMLVEPESDTRLAIDFTQVAPGDVVQLDPRSDLGRDYGPQLLVVNEVQDWGLLAYFVQAGQRGNFGSAYLRVKRGTYIWVGRAAWVDDSTARELKERGETCR